MYTVCVQRDINSLVNQVNELMEQGWVPTGGVARERVKIALDDTQDSTVQSQVLYLQAMLHPLDHHLTLEGKLGQMLREEAQREQAEIEESGLEALRKMDEGDEYDN